MWRIVFTYNDKSTLKISGKHKDIPGCLVEKYLREYARPNNDGGFYQKSPYKNNPPVPLADIKILEDLHE